MKPVIYCNFHWQPPLIDRGAQVAIMVDYLIEPCEDFWKAPVRIFIQAEPPCVLPDVLSRVLRDQNKFAAILGWHQTLRSCPNAEYYQLSALTRLPDNYRLVDNKRFGATFLTSAKAWCPGHLLRQEIYNVINGFDGFDVIKLRCAGQYVDKKDFIGSHQFGIDAENSRVENYFTEKLTDLCIAKVVPIYCGCPNIADFGFDTSGILTFSSVEDLQGILHRLTPDTYNQMSDAIEHNFEQAKKWSDKDLLDRKITEVLNETVHSFSLAPA
jgi:hypothetical protein